MAVSNYNKNKLVYIAVREKGYNGDKYKGYTDIKGPKAGGFVLPIVQVQDYDYMDTRYNEFSPLTDLEEENIENSNIKKATLESISAQISDLQNSILEIKKSQKNGYPNLDSRFKDSETRLE